MDRTVCVDCAAIAPADRTNYTVIGRGWRLHRRSTASGYVAEWRCNACWRKFKEANGPLVGSTTASEATDPARRPTKR